MDILNRSLKRLFPRAFRFFELSAPYVSIATSVYTVAIFLTAAVLFTITTCLLFADQIAHLLHWIAGLLLLLLDFMLSCLRQLVDWLLEGVAWISSILALIGLGRLAWGLGIFIKSIPTDNQARMLKGIKSTSVLLYYSVYAGVVCLLMRAQDGADLATVQALYWIETWTILVFAGMLLILLAIRREVARRRVALTRTL